MKIIELFKNKYAIYDIVLYDHQGTLKTGTITKIHDQYEEKLYELDTQVVIREDNILKRLGNMKKLRKEIYGG